MKRYKIKYQKGNDILITEIEAESALAARLRFELNNLFCDILSIEEVIDDATEPQQN